MTTPNDRNQGHVIGVNGNLVTVRFEKPVRQNELAFVHLGEDRIKAEIIRIQGTVAQLQAFEEIRGLRVGDPVLFTGELLSVALGPGLLGRIYDGLQNPLPDVAEKYGFFIPRGASLPPLDTEKSWAFEPLVRPGDTVEAGHFLGWVPEGVFRHRLMVPFHLRGALTVRFIARGKPISLDETIAELEGPEGERHAVKAVLRWPIKIPIRCYTERLLPTDPLTTGIRIVDTLSPVVKGGTYCTPGPFGAGKTVLQQITARHAEVDIVVIAACGERAGEVVETLKEFPRIEDPRTGRSLMERTVIVCNTSSMPVASRESSIYTAVTIAEYYRQLGLDVLLLADSTSRWAQALREISGRLEEIPGEEAYPAYLESRIAAFYERAGKVRLYTGETGSVTIGGTVSPAGGTFEEPVTQGTLKVVGAFHGLSRERASARRFPAIDPYESWSNYVGFIDPAALDTARSVLLRGKEVGQMMKVVGEEGTSLADYAVFLQSEFLDQVYLQQNAFDPVDRATPRERQVHVFGVVTDILNASFHFTDKTHALQSFQSLRQAFIDWNYTAWNTEAFEEMERGIRNLFGEMRSSGQEGPPGGPEGARP